MSDMNLWGEIGLDAEMQTPVAILREQAHALTKLTSGVIEGEISVSNTTARIQLTFDAIAPALDGYSHTILVARHDVLLYPVVTDDQVRGKRFKCEDEAQLRDVLGQILSSPEVHKVVRALYAQSKAT